MTANNAAPAFATIMFLTGVGIPILAALNGGLGARLGSPMAASMILFGLAFLIATTVVAGFLPRMRRSRSVTPAIGSAFCSAVAPLRLPCRRSGQASRVILIST